MKLIRQNRKKKDCAVVATYNALEWCKKPTSYEEVEKIAKSCGYSLKKGIYLFQFNNLTKRLGIPAKRFKPKKLDDIVRRLYKGKLLIFFYTPTGCDSGHIISVFLDHTEKVSIINPDSKRVTWRSFVSDLSKNGVKDFAIFEIPERKSKT